MFGLGVDQEKEKQKMEALRQAASYHGGLSEERKMQLLKRKALTAEELEDEKHQEEDFWASIDMEAMSRLELKTALEARGLDVKGSKQQLIERLEQSIEEEKQAELEFLAMVEAQRRAEAALEESGSVYVIGTNTGGQLGLGTESETSVGL